MISDDNKEKNNEEKNHHRSRVQSQKRDQTREGIIYLRSLGKHAANR